MSFCHNPAGRPCRCHCDEPKSCRCHESAECCGGGTGHGRATDPEVGALRDRLRYLENSISRLTSVVKGEPPVAQPKETKDEEDDEAKETNKAKGG